MDVTRVNEVLREAVGGGGERWKDNFVVTAPVTLAVAVTAAENNGWRAEVGVSQGGKVIERQPFSTKWFKTFEEAKKEAKRLARVNKIQFKPKPYGERK